MRNSFTFTLIFITALAGCVSQTVNAPEVSGTQAVQPVSSASVSTPVVIDSTSSESALATLALDFPSNPIQSSTTSTLLPDLVVFYSYLDFEGRTENCNNGHGGYEVRVVVKNIGTTPAAGFDVELNGVRQQYDGQLLPDELAVIHFSGVPSNGIGQILVDASNHVQESNEDNNTGQYIAITPTLPLICTPTPVP